MIFTYRVTYVLSYPEGLKDGLTFLSDRESVMSWIEFAKRNARYVEVLGWKGPFRIGGYSKMPKLSMNGKTEVYRTNGKRFEYAVIKPDTGTRYYLYKLSKGGGIIGKPSAWDSQTAAMQQADMRARDEGLI